MNKIKALSVIALSIAVLACNKNNIDSGTSPDKEVYLDLPEQPYKYFTSSSGQSHMNYLATLGRVLFYDGHLSVNNAVACANCHKQQFAFADNVAFSRGFENRPTGRNSMTIQDMAQPFMSNGTTPVFSSQFLFWDGRESTLSNLVMRPIGNHVEMGVEDVNTLPSKLSGLSYYNKLFKDAYGDETVTVERISQAIAVFMTSIQTGNSRFDQEKLKQTSFTAQEEYGRQLFNNKYNCNNCHQLNQGAYSIAVDFMNIGLSTDGDKGRSVISGSPADVNKFKIPNLRNVALTAPYMHDGRFETLEQVLNHYSSGINDDPNLDIRLRGTDGKPMRMNISDNEKTALIAFLSTLTDYNMISDAKYSNPFKIK